MGLQTADALILEVRDLQERDRIVVFLTRERGKLSGVAKGARTKHSRFAGLLQPLARVRLTWYEREGRDLVRLSSVDLERPAAPLQQDLDDILLGSYLAEHLLVFAQENEPARLYFRLLDSTLEALLAGVDRDLAARYFESWMLRLAGLYPPPLHCPGCGRRLVEGAVTSRAEGLVCVECAGGSEGPPPALPPGVLAVSSEVVVFLLRITAESLPEMAQDPPPPAVLARAREVAARLRRSFLQAELKSFRVMERMAAEGEAAREPPPLDDRRDLS